MSANRYNRFWLPAVLLLAAALFLGGCAAEEAELIQADTEESISTESGEDSEEDSESEETEESMSEENTVVVHVCGAVQSEGVYKLPSGSRYLDAVEAAGGFTEEAATDYLNLATVLTDGEKIVVPTEEEAASLEAAASSSAAEEESDGLVDINTADREELMTLTGIGEVKADAIIAYREEYGDFETIEDIMNVSGIKEGAFAKIKDQIKVGTSDG